MNYIKDYKKNKRIKLKKFVLIFTAILGIYGISSILYSKIESDNNEIVNVCEEECIEKASKNIVGISRSDNSFDNSVTSWGSGVVISKKGYILTNEHVSGSKNGICYVVLNSKEKYKGNIVWSNSDTDLSIVKIDCNFEDCAILGDSDALKLGQKIYTIGNPIGIDFQKSVSAGVVSGTNRNLEFEENGKKFYIDDLIQTDATINQGNSGGALINSAGQLVGITTIKISSAEAIGFAVPINIVKPILKKLENTGKFKQATLGIWGYDKYSIQKINTGVHLENGIYVGQVNLNSGSEKAGIKVGDVIISINGKNLEKISNLRLYIFEKNPGDEVLIKIKRGNSEYNVQVKLDEAV
ncbi:MAG: trypsin-like peptidase domain-containing protein [Clostridia bacterium]|nr:trypsin-like peptidase domain-containing protein [Clostridia bacterium]